MQKQQVVEKSRVRDDDAPPPMPNKGDGDEDGNDIHAKRPKQLLKRSSTRCLRSRSAAPVAMRRRGSSYYRQGEWVRRVKVGGNGCFRKIEYFFVWNV